MNEEVISRAFGKQAVHYDRVDRVNPILLEWRQQVYTHVARFLKPQSFILELNAGTGIDAMRFVKQGHRVHAIDIARGMLDQLESKKELNGLDRLTFQELSFENLAALNKGPFDYIFSNFGGLNCTNDLNKIGKHIPSVLNPGGYVTWVIMPPVCLWEWLNLLRGQHKKAFRRLSRNGAEAHLEGEYFQVYYHPVRKVQKALGENFRLVGLKGLGSLSPPPSSTLPVKASTLYKLLNWMDSKITTVFPFNRWADHVIVTFQFNR